MQVESISATKQRFNDKIYTLYRGEKYFSKGTKRLHRVVWEVHNGEIPGGYDIHHKDHDKTNNQIDNLELVNSGEHRSLHVKMYHRNNPDAARKNLEKVQDKCREWHKSEKGNEWHKNHYEETKEDEARFPKIYGI